LQKPQGRGTRATIENVREDGPKVSTLPKTTEWVHPQGQNHWKPGPRALPCHRSALSV